MSAALGKMSDGPLPETIPVFPLCGALLLPRGTIPLNIFEPRYLNMVVDALAAERIIGMVQPREIGAGPVPDDAPLYGVGCAGRITSFSESDDGRYLIKVTGVARFSTASELEPLRGYRRVAASYDEYADDLNERTIPFDDRPRLFDVVERYFEATGINADCRTMEALPDETLVSALAMACPLEPRDKQALLECNGVAERGTFLCDLMEFRTRAGDRDSSLPRH
ncbi:MAG: LON peptidase substrate-binding domain-containing protein [Rhodospirillales bacterium]|nr:LON peptidase substrate-binding domain-containing protein [Rhodospirillales bacterium]